MKKTWSSVAIVWTGLRCTYMRSPEEMTNQNHLTVVTTETDARYRDMVDKTEDRKRAKT